MGGQTRIKSSYSPPNGSQADSYLDAIRFRHVAKV
jgi:hypothetical protein